MNTTYAEARQRIAELREAITNAKTKTVVRELNEELTWWQGRAATLGAS